MHLLHKRWLGECFDSIIDLDDYQEEINQAMIHQAKVQRVVDAMLSGSLSLKDMLESVEDCVPNMDNYMDMVADNIENKLLIL